MARDRTTIEIERSTWKELNALKEPGDSFEDVIQRLLHPEESQDCGEEAEEIPDGGGGMFPMRCDCGKTLHTSEEAGEHLSSCPKLDSY